MSTTTTTTTGRGAVLRIILPKNNARLIGDLGPTRKLETREIRLSSGRLTTDEIAKYIREFSKLRDEVLHTIRVLGVQRNPKNNRDSLTDLRSLQDGSWRLLDQTKTEQREVTGIIEKLEREAEEARKKIALINQVLETGFNLEDVKPTGVGFSKMLGRVPTRRLQDLQKALQSSLNDQVILAIGKRQGDFAHVLVAVPSDRTTQALQTLVLHDFIQTEVPSVDQANLKDALIQETARRDSRLEHLESERKKLQDIVARATERLNELADISQEALILLRAVLRIGEGATAEHAFTILEKNPPSKAVESLTRAGALLETE